MPALPRPKFNAHAVGGLVLCAALFAHAWLVTRGWTSRQLPGHEFRQTQTAISALFTQRDGYHLAYPLPLFGPPWTAPLEFPLYQWAAAAVSTTTHTPLIPAARSVGLACFYLSLPAIWLLLRRAQLSAPARCVALSLVLLSPLYIYYTRAVLIESMALMFSLWFAATGTAALATRRWPWILLGAAFGALAAVVKITTWVVYLLPVLWLGGTQMFSKLRAQERSSAWAHLGVLAALIVPAILIAGGWVAWSDAIKLGHPATAFLASSQLRQHNFGTWELRTSAPFWADLWRMWHRAFGSAWLLPVVALIALRAGRFGRLALGCVALTVAAPLIFPYLYSWHDYYHYATALLLPIGAVSAAAGLWQRGRRLIPIALTLLCLACGYQRYVKDFAPSQRLHSFGGTPLTSVLRDLTDADDVLVIAGADWNAAISLYTERRALMLRRNEEQNWSMIEPTFARLQDDFVAAVVVMGDQRRNHRLLELAQARLGTDARPLLAFEDAVVYVNRAVRPLFLSRLAQNQFQGVKVLDDPAHAFVSVEGSVKALHRPHNFSMMSPVPVRYQAMLAPSVIDVDGERRYSAQSPNTLWFSVPAGKRQITAGVGLFASSYTGSDHPPTDGIEVTIGEQPAGGAERILWRRYLDPLHRVEDRGTQTIELSIEHAADTELVFRVGPGPKGDPACDWAYWTSIQIK